MPASEGGRPSTSQACTFGETRCCAMSTRDTAMWPRSMASANSEALSAEFDGSAAGTSASPGVDMRTGVGLSWFGRWDMGRHVANEDKTPNYRAGAPARYTRAFGACLRRYPAVPGLLVSLHMTYQL